MVPKLPSNTVISSNVSKLCRWTTNRERVTGYEPHHEKTCLSYMRTTKVQISLRIHAVSSAPLLFAA